MLFDIFSFLDAAGSNPVVLGGIVIFIAMGVAWLWTAGFHPAAEIGHSRQYRAMHGKQPRGRRKAAG
ncbi:MAG: hypothetical protein EHM70_14320 [Chloroflexota bacterium]|nr:MAG: hypothetical protein EHM70_14320 [Chloroflexota bacterium]